MQFSCAEREQLLLHVVNVAVRALDANDTPCTCYIHPSSFDTPVFADQLVTDITFLHCTGLTPPTTFTVLAFHEASTTSSVFAFQIALAAITCFQLLKNLRDMLRLPPNHS